MHQASALSRSAGGTLRPLAVVKEAEARLDTADVAGGAFDVDQGRFFRAARAQFKLLSLYQRFEHVIIVILAALIAIVVVATVWNLTLKILLGLVLAGSFDPSDYSTCQAVFGMIFTVIIALEFKKSLPIARPAWCRSRPWW